MMAQMLLMGAARPLTVSFSGSPYAYNSGIQPCKTVGPTSTPGASVSGGSGNYTYSWARTATNHTGNLYTISSASALNPTWSATVCAVSTGSETWELTVTDTNTNAQGTGSRTVTLEYEQI